MTVCKFFAQGNCKFGDKCRFEHPASLDQNQRNTGLFGRTRNEPSPRGYSPRAGPRNQPQARYDARRPLPYHLDRTILEEDLRSERPMWIMSSYGPGRDAPRQLFGGPLEQSPEEIRVAHYLAVMQGKSQEAIQAEAEAANLANTQVRNALNDIDGALQYIIDGAKEHPNRLDVCATSSAATTSNQRSGGSGVFSRSQRAREPPTAPAAFEQPLASGFGAPQTTQSSGFGKPSAPTSSFNPFSQQSLSPSTFGQQKQQGSELDQPPQQSAGFGQSQRQPNAFGQPQSLAATTFGNNSTQLFGQQSSPAPGGFVSSGFGQGLAPSSVRSFGPEHQQQTQQASTNVFGQKQQSAIINGFGQQNSISSNNAFEAFSKSPDPPPMNSGFGTQRNQQARQQLNGNTTLSFGGNNNASQIDQDVSTYTTHSADGRLLTFKGRPVFYPEPNEPCFRGPDGSLERIWFPNGPPTKFQLDDMGEIQYPRGIKESFEYLNQNGRFLNGAMPEVPPKAEDNRWDL